MICEQCRMYEAQQDNDKCENCIEAYLEGRQAERMSIVTWLRRHIGDLADDIQNGEHIK